MITRMSPAAFNAKKKKNNGQFLSWGEVSGDFFNLCDRCIQLGILESGDKIRTTLVMWPHLHCLL